MRRIARVSLPALHRLAWLGIALWLVAAATVASTVLSELEAHRLAVQSPDDPSPAYFARAREIDALLQHIPPAADRERLVADLLDAASASGLEVSGGRYREEPIEAGVLRRIETTLPVVGDRMAVLRWGDRLGEVLPAAVLTRVSLTRADVKDPFSGDVRLDLLLRGTQ
jgi:hypothetical protein